MTTYIQTVRTRALAGREAEYRDWYVNTHIPQMLSLDGFVSAKLHRMVTADTAPAEFLCIYTIETTDLAATQSAMMAAGASVAPSPAMDLPATLVEVFQGSNA
jgi:hypothetical protein